MLCEETLGWVDMQIAGKKPGWWFGTMEFYDFPYIGNSNPNWLYNIFQSGSNHQPETY